MILMNSWEVEGWYHNLGMPFGCFIGADTAEDVLRWVITHTHENDPPERQITVWRVKSRNSLAVTEFGKVKSDDTSTWPKFI